MSQILTCALFNTSIIMPAGHIVDMESLRKYCIEACDTCLIPNCFHKYYISFYSSKTLSDAFSPTVLTLGLSMF